MAEREKTIPSTHLVDARATGVPTGSEFHEPPKKEEIDKAEKDKEKSE